MSARQQVCNDRPSGSTPRLAELHRSPHSEILPTDMYSQPMKMTRRNGLAMVAHTRHLSLMFH